MLKSAYNVCKKIKKLSYHRETAPRFDVIEFFSKSLEVIRNDTVEYGVCIISYRFWDIQRRIIIRDLETGVGVAQGHWNWRNSIDHIRLSIGRPLYVYHYNVWYTVCILRYTIFELFDVE